jgi:RES domain-containing protein
MPSAWRLTKTKFVGDPLSGDGARLYGGRWNSPGVSVVYFAESISLAVLEVLVHLEATRILESYSLVRIDFEQSNVRTMAVDELPLNWADYPAPAELQAIGNAWVEASESLLLKVPSTIIPFEHILLLNPAHPDRGSISVAEPFPFRLDPRLLT